MDRNVMTGPREADRDSLAQYLLSFDWPLRDAAAEERLVAGGLSLWMEILRLIPPRAERGRLLELGSPPFHITLLVQKLRNYEMTLAAALSDGARHARQGVRSARHGEEYVFDCVCFDLEGEPFPLPDDHFDVVLFCEVIEHLTENPIAALSEIHRVLKPGGALVLSTPNVASLCHALLLLGGGNIYDPYHLGASLRGSRHSREYTLAELVMMIEGCGFRIDRADGRDLQDATELVLKMAFGDTPPTTRLPYWALRIVGSIIRFAPRVWRGLQSANRTAPPGTAPRFASGDAHAEHLFVRAIKDGPFRWRFPAGVFDPGHLAGYVRVSDAEVVMGRNDVQHLGFGWGPLEAEPGQTPRRRAGAAAGVHLAPREQPTAVVIELCGTGGAAPVEVQVWQGKADAARCLASQQVTPSAREWTRLEIPLGTEATPRDEVQVRVLAESGVYVHRIALTP